MGHHHAREAIGGASMIFLMQYLCQNYATDSRIKDLVDNREIFIIVCANPDGWEHNRTLSASGGGQWRKNRRNNGSGQYGVDLNRNWGVNFANCTGAVGAASCGSSTTERSLATTVANGATSVTVTWVGLTGGSVGSSFIRFRLASSAAEAGSPFGFARNGEVEDYPFPINQVNLPVELVEFKGELKEDKTSLLTWKTASELNNDYFDVQRKKQDGTGWETIGKVDGYGNSNQLISYSFIDSKPETGENYYRLNQVDFDGRSEFSNTIMLKLDAAATPEVKDDFVVYPNPAKNEFWIKSVQNRNTDTELTLDLFNITGEKIYSSVMKDNVLQVDVSNYQTGMYFIRIGTKTYRIIKE
jgi:hypothetical protein